MEEPLPQNQEVEESVLSSILQHEDDRKKAFKLLTADDFYSGINRTIFQKSRELCKRGVAVGVDTVFNELDDDERETIKPHKLTHLLDNVPATVDIEHSAQILKDLHQKRRAVELANAIAKRAIDSDMGKVNDLVNQLVAETKEPATPQKEQCVSAFPYKVMTGAAGFFTNCYQEVLEVPAAFLFMAYLTCLGAVLSRLLSLKSELKTQARLFVTLVGESALDRKSTALNTVTGFFKNVVNAFRTCWGVSSAEGLQKLLNNSQGDDDSSGLILVLDELKQFVSKCKIDSSVLLPCVNTLFESNRYHSHTKKVSLEIEDAHLSLLAASTLQTYERIFNESFIDIGFPNRIFLVVGTAERKYSIPKKISDSDLEMMESNLVKILKHVGNGLELDIDPDARVFYHNWYMNLERSIHARRLDTYSLRLMMLLAVNNLKTSIDLEVAQQATALCDWELEVRKLHDPIDADTSIAKMEEKIRRQLKRGPLKDRELKQKTGAYRAGLWFYDTALNNLRRAAEVAWNKRNRTWMYLEN